MTRLEAGLLAFLFVGCALIVAGVARFSAGGALIVSGVLVVALVWAFVRRGGLGVGGDV